MKKLIPIVICLMLFANNCSIYNEIVPPYYLAEQYFISATKDKTLVDATVFSERLGRFKNTKPVSKIQVNGTEMKKGVLNFEHDDSPNCENYEKEENDKLTLALSDASPEPTPTSTVEQYKFFTRLNGYQQRTQIIITDKNNQTHISTIEFVPIEPLNSEKIIISRSKDTIIKLKGKGSGKKDDVSYLVSQGNGNFLDEKIIPYNSDNNQLTFPSSATKKLSKGKATFILNSIYSGFLDPAKSWTGYFSVSFRTEVCAEIVD